MIEHAAKVTAFSISSAIAGVPILVAAAGEQFSLLTAEGWLQVALQSVGAFLMTIFLIWVWPQQNKFLRDMTQDMQKTIKENNEANTKVVEALTAAFERHDTAWRELMAKRGYCPVRDGILQEKHHHEQAG